MKPSQRPALLLAALCAAAAAAAVPGAHAQDAPGLPPVEATSPQAPDAAAAATEVRIERKTDQMEIAIAYPLLPAGEPGGAAGNATIKARMDGLLADFESEYQSSAADLAESPDEDRPAEDGPAWTLDISYGDIYTGPGFWSVPFTVYQFAGGAHGSTQTLPLVIARGTGAEIPPAGLFRDGANWLPVLADACYADLAGREAFQEGDDEWLREGTAPTPDNYQALLPRADGLQVSFQQYQVGPYVIGAFDVLVPYSKLEGLLAGEVARD